MRSKAYQYDVAGARDAPFTQSYVLPVIDFGAGDSETVIVAPSGRFGVVRGVEVTRVTETFNADSSPARVDVGISGGDADAHAVGASLGLLAAGATLYPAFTKGASRNLIPRDASIGVNCIAPTGGTPTGIADVIVTISWYK